MTLSRPPRPLPQVAGGGQATMPGPGDNQFTGADGNGSVTPTDLDKLFQIPAAYNALPQSAGFSVVPGQQFNVPDNTVEGIGDTTGMNTQQLLTHLQNLAPEELRIVQADLANAGYYGAITKMTDEPTWGFLTAKDVTAMRAFVLDGIQAAQSGQTLNSLLALKTQQFSAQMSKGTSQTPIFDLGTDYTVSHLDQTSVNDQADKAALAILGHGLTDQERAQVYSQLDAKGVAQQQNLNSTKAARALSDATAKASLTIDPTTGQPVAFTGVDSTARNLIGKIAYKFGGTSPATGLDCSGFTQFVMQQNGLAIGRTTSDQWANPAGVQVGQDQAQPGDLVFFGSPTDDNHAHVGVYIGNGMMIDNAHTGTSTRVDAIAGFGMPILGFKHFNIPGQPNTTPAGAFTPGFNGGGGGNNSPIGIGSVNPGAPVDVGGFSVSQDAPAQDPVQAATGPVGGPAAANDLPGATKPIISTPDTTTDTTALDVNSEINDMIRRLHPDEAAAHDFSNAYDQFQSIMRGI